ncbi:MAG TPA: calcium-binding protein [Gammaproteobacteria bacterium]|nr:calcium-binding protein [Gammaproteobacteria bacterium]
MFGGLSGETPPNCESEIVPLVLGIEGELGGGSACALPNRDRLFGGAGSDVLDGGTEADDLYGGAGKDDLRGGTGDDNLDGGDGIDTMAGGEGSDTYHVDGYVEVIPPDDGGSGGSGGDSGPEDGDEDDDSPHGSGKGNEGVGNGEDPPPPGHDRNENDGEGTGPGHPGHKAQGEDDDEDASDPEPWVSKGKTHEEAGKDGWEGDDDEDDKSHQGGGRPKDSHHHAEDDKDHHDWREGHFERESPEGECVGDEEGGGAGGGGQQTGPKRIIHTDQVTEDANAGYDRVYASITYTLPVHVEALTLTGTDPLDGTGNADGNWMVGNSAANTLDGAGGGDTMWGREGDDTYVVDDPWDRVRELAGDGHDTVRSSIGYTLQDPVEDLTLTGEAAIDGTGHGGANALTGNAGANTLKGLGGADTLTGAGGDDRLQGGSGDDTYRFARGHGSDRITDSAGNDRIAFAEGIAPDRVVARTATDANGETTASIRVLDEHGSEVPGQRIEFTLTNGVSPVERFTFADGTEKTLAELTVGPEIHEGTRRPDAIRTGRNDDIVHAGGGPDLIRTGIGNDRLYGQGQPDGLYGQGGHDWLVGGRGSDTLDQGFGDDAAFGGRGHDRLYGSGGNDAQLGGRGHDELTGDAGNDLMAGAPGNDELEAACGSDVVAFNRGDGRDRVETGEHLGKLTLSLGGGIALEDLTLRRRGEDLVLGVGPRQGHPRDPEKAGKEDDGGEGGHSNEASGAAGQGRASQGRDDDRSKAGKDEHDESPERCGPRDALVLAEWYEDDGEHRPESATLQMVTEATDGYDPTADSERLSHKLNRYDFTRIVEAFDQARADGKGRGGKARRWEAMDAALDNHLEGSDSEALGGELAHRYGVKGSLDGASRQTVLATLADERFGEKPQSLQSGSGST